MRKIAVLIFLISITSAAFSSPSDCFKGIIDSEFKEFQSWNINAKQIMCMESYEDLKPSIDQLCSSDRKAYSENLVVYLEYKRVYDETLQLIDFKSEKSKAIGLLKLSNVEMDWKLRGFKNEIDALLFPFWSAKEDCVKKN